LQPRLVETIEPEHNSTFWATVDRIVESMDVPAILAHQLAPLAARRWRTLERQLPGALLERERAAQFVELLAIPVLARARDAYPGRMLILKGPEIAALYPPGGRLFGDIDLLVDDAPAALRALEAAGFEEIHSAIAPRPHHLPPVWWPGSGLPIELHVRPSWPRHLEPPPNGELFDEAIASKVPVTGLEAPAPAHHAVLMAAHCWRHMPLRSVRDLIDVTLLAAQADAHEVERTARRWGMIGVWRTTAATAQWLLEDGKPPAATRIWARNLRPPREASILEKHVRRWVTPFWMLPPVRAVPAAMKNIAADVRPVGGEGWSTKLRRIAWVAAHPSRTRSKSGYQELDELDEGF
jgi:putative nucleotidyltransferase-like protein